MDYSEHTYGRRLCLCIATRERTHWQHLIEGEPLVELRSDLMGLTEGDLSTLIPLAERAIVTHHTGEQELRERLYREAIDARAWAVDLEQGMPTALRHSLTESAHRKGVRVVISHHYPTTPSLEQLSADAASAFEEGADIVKIITTAHTTAEAIVPLGLYERFENDRLVAFAMGTKGRFSRRLSLLKGAPHTYVAPSESVATAEGQPTKAEMLESLCATHSLEPYSLPATLTPPSSKSEAQRAIVLAALAEGTTTLTNLSPCGDTDAALSLIGALGAQVERLPNGGIRIEGVGIEGVRRGIVHIGRLHVGESALLARLTMPLVATLLCDEQEVGIEAEGSLRQRPLDSSLLALRELGASFVPNDASSLPLTLRGGVRLGGDIVVRDGGSSQLISGLMIAATVAPTPTTIELPRAVSRPYLHLTARMMEHFGARVAIEQLGEGAMRIEIHPCALRGCRHLRISSDWSAAGYFAAAYAIAQSGALTQERYTLRVQRGTGQADERIVEVLTRMGAHVEWDSEGMHLLPSAPLVAFEEEATDAPDMIPTLAILALHATGISRIGGIGRLQTKESNREEALVESLMAMGARVWIEGEELLIEGGTELHAAPLLTHNDHRMAMAQTIAGLFMPQRPRLDEVECVAKSFPTFFRLLQK